mgnify:CR=1 FL=1
MVLSNPIRTLKRVSRDPSWKWVVSRQKGGTILSVDLQRFYLKEIQRRYAGRDEQTDWVLREWETVLDALETDPLQLADRLDWVAKYQMFQMYMKEEGAGWHDDVMYSLDLEYHNTDPERSLASALQDAGQLKRLSQEADVFRAMHHPPTTTRAAGRARVVKGLIERRQPHYVIEWDGILADEDRVLLFENPFHDYLDEADDFLKLF